jgi:hypothetical protein
MTKPPKQKDGLEGDPKRGDEILKRMLRTKPKPHKDMVAERKSGRVPPGTRRDKKGSDR